MTLYYMQLKTPNQPFLRDISVCW